MLIARQIDDGHNDGQRPSIVRPANRHMCVFVSVIILYYYLLGCTCFASGLSRGHALESVPCVAKCQRRRRRGRRAMRLYRCARAADAAREIGACTVQRRACA